MWSKGRKSLGGEGKRVRELELQKYNQFRNLGISRLIIITIGERQNLGKRFLNEEDSRKESQGEEGGWRERVEEIGIDLTGAVGLNSKYGPHHLIGQKWERSR